MFLGKPDFKLRRMIFEARISKTVLTFIKSG